MVTTTKTTASGTIAASVQLNLNNSMIYNVYTRKPVALINGEKLAAKYDKRKGKGPWIATAWESTPEIDSLAERIARHRAKLQSYGSTRGKEISAGIRSRLTSDMGNTVTVHRSTTGTGIPIEEQMIEELKAEARKSLIASHVAGLQGYTALKIASKDCARLLHRTNKEQVFSDVALAEKAQHRALKLFREQSGIDSYEIDQARKARHVALMRQTRRALRLYWQAKRDKGYRRAAWCLLEDLRTLRHVAMSPFTGGFVMPARDTAGHKALRRFQTRCIEARAMMPARAKKTQHGQDETGTGLSNLSPREEREKLRTIPVTLTPKLTAYARRLVAASEAKHASAPARATVEIAQGSRILCLGDIMPSNIKGKKERKTSTPARAARKVRVTSVTLWNGGKQYLSTAN